MKEIELKGIGVVVLREMDNDDREILQNKGVDTICDENGKPISQNVKSGTITKYTFILSVVKAPFFKTEVGADGITDSILKSRELEYKNIDYRIISTLLPHIRDINKLDESDFEELKKN